MDLTIDEYIDYKHLCVLEGLLEKNIEYQRLNLPSRQDLLKEVKSELNRIENLDKERRERRKRRERSYTTEPLDEVKDGAATMEPGDEL